MGYGSAMERDDIEAAIRSAFAGVRLGSGVSLQEARLIYERRTDLSQAAFDAIPRLEITDDWAAIPEEELENDCIAHLDAEGLRYYLPALMFWLLDHYDDDYLLRGPEARMTKISTIAALARSSKDAKDSQRRWDGFTDDQRAAIASYLDALPRLVDLDYEDTVFVARSLEANWHSYLGGDGK